jgi:hypothetical protein
MAAAALGLASLQRFGGPGGRTPALLHEAYLAAADSAAARARLAAALARSWVYGNDAPRGAPFALEAVELAEETHDPTVLADALDAQLATSWGPGRPARAAAQWWLRRVSAPYGAKRGAPVAAPRPVDRRTVEMRRLPGQTVWSVGPAGEARLLPDMKGLHYLRALLQRPGVEITALEMSAMVAGHGTAVAEPGAGERLDRRALTAYRNRLREIDEELDEAQSWNDPARAERLAAEREALLRELTGATGLGGRARTMGGTAERARVAVRKAIAAALDRIDAEDPAMARLLRRTVHTGSVCRYEPDPDTPVDWLL